MTEALLAAGEVRNVLEIGTGCGYQTAVLSPLVEKIYTIERIASLLGRARRTLRELRIRNVSFRHDDGNIGWAARALSEAFFLHWYRTGVAYSRLIRSRRVLARVT